jgi:peptide-methionine (R)-S-oxide reductase
MGVQHLLKLRMASLHPHPAAPLATRRFSALSSLLLTPSSAAASSPRPALLACSRAYCPAARPAAGRCRGRTAGRRLPGVVVAMSSSAPTPGPVQKSEEEWEAILTPEQFRILRRKGTE